MTTLAKYYSSSLVGFFSYSREDDADFSDVLSKFRIAIQAELSAQLGRNRDNFRIWQDRFAIAHGALWKKEISEGIRQSAFFVPIITPRMVNSHHCAFEFDAFLAREAELNRDDLVFPILYIRVPELDDDTLENSSVLKIVKDRQYLDWRDFRHRSLESPEAGKQIGEFCQNIAEALRRSWLSPEERREQEEVAAKRKDEEEKARRTAEIVRQKAVDAENARIAAEAKRREKEQREAQRREAERRRREDEIAAQNAREHQAFDDAKRLGTVAAFDEFLRTCSNATYIGEAQKLRKSLLERQNAYSEAMESNDPAVLRSFCRIYSGGTDSDDIRARLKSLSPGLVWKVQPRTMAAATPIILILLAGALFWFGRSSFQPLATSTSSAAKQDQHVTTVAVSQADRSVCLPGLSQKVDYVGGPLSRLTLKLAVKPKPIRSIAISPDNTLLASAGDDGTIQIWDLAGMKWIRQISGQPAPIYSVAFSDSGKLLASAGWDGTVRIFDMQNFAQIQSFSANGDNGPVPQNGVAFEPGPTPRYVNSGGEDGSVWVWDMSANALKTKKSSGDLPVRALSFAPHGNGDFVTASFDGKIRFFTPGKIQPVTASSGKVLHVAYSPDAKQVASAGVDPSNKGLKLWDAVSLTPLKSFEGHIGYATSAAWSIDAGRIVSGGGAKDLAVRIWDVKSGTQLQALFGHTADIEAVVFHPNQKWAISASEDGTMKLWDTGASKLLLTSAVFDNGDYLEYASSGCYTGSNDAPNYVKILMKDPAGTEQDVTATAKDALFVPGNSPLQLLQQ